MRKLEKVYNEALEFVENANAEEEKMIKKMEMRKGINAIKNAMKIFREVGPTINIPRK